MKTPLEGLRVVELARILAGPFAGQTLADLGAEVIKVEARNGDDTRGWGPPFIDHDGESSAAYFHSCNRGKASITIDLTNADDQQRLKELIISSDILVENFKVGGLKKYGFDYESVKSINPALIYCSITGFGQTGPYAHRAGYDYIIQGMSGFMSITGESGGMPQRAGVAVTDLFTGLYATTAILSALHMRNNTGQGQHIDMALLDCAVSVMVNQAMNFMSTGVSPERVGNIHPNLCPYQVFECSDGHIIIAVGNDGQFARLCSILDLENLSQNPLFVTNKQRVLNRNQLTSKLSAAIRLMEKNTLLKLCEDKNVPAGPINTMEEVFNDPQVISREMELNFKNVRGVASPFKFSDAKLKMQAPSPKLGQDDSKF